MAKKYKSSSDNLLILWMMISSANLAYYLFNTPAELDFFGFTLPVLSTPFLYLYVRALSHLTLTYIHQCLWHTIG
jgi:hypothetical protein